MDEFSTNLLFKKKKINPHGAYMLECMRLIRFYPVLSLMIKRSFKGYNLGIGYL